MSRMTDAKLTLKQQAFVRAYIETGNACEAYRRAYNPRRMSAKAITVESTRLMQHPRVALAVQNMQRKLAERHAITVDSITEMLKEDRKLARELDMPAAAVAAAMGLAKLHGLIVEKRHNTNVNVDATQLSDAELEDIAAGRGEAFAAPAPGPALTH